MYKHRIHARIYIPTVIKPLRFNPLIYNVTLLSLKTQVKTDKSSQVK